MATGRKLVSDVRGTHKLLSTDGLITDRVILSSIRDNSLLLIKRETNLRRLWATATLFTTIPCLEMKEVPISECGNYVDDCTIAKSVHKLPKIAEGNYQYVIQGVYPVDAMGGKSVKIKEITVNRYINLLRLPLVKKESYFWVLDGYLYVTNPMVQAIRLVALFEEDIPNEIMYPSEDCNCAKPNISEEEYCKNPLDKEFPLPGYLSKQVLKLTSDGLLETYFRIKTDVSQDGVDGQAPNTPNMS